MGRVTGTPVAVNGPESFQDDVSTVVRSIAATATGRAILAKITAHGIVVITPMNKGEVNALAHPVVLGGLAPIQFSPTTWSPVTLINGFPVPNIYASFPGMQADEVLLHEMVHSARGLGREAKVIKLTGAMAPYENEEEFFAILVANIYESEKGKSNISLRRSHFFEMNSLTPNEAASEVFLFLNDNFRLIAKFCEQHPKMAPTIARVEAKFNPIKAYFFFMLKPVPPPPGPIVDLKSHEDVPSPTQIVQRERRPALTDDYLISILKPRYHADDVAGYGGRVWELEKIFGSVSPGEAAPLFMRLTLRQSSDLVARYFHGHLSTPTRTKLLQLLLRRII
jgi:hypothetical protein